MTNSIFGSVILAGSSFFVSLASFTVSWLSYKRDSGRCDVFVGMGSIFDRTSKAGNPTILLKIVNSGRRPIIINLIGGDLKGQFINRCLDKIFRSRKKAIAFFLDSPLIRTALMPDGHSRVLEEGHEITVCLPLPECISNLEQMANESDSIYAIDTLGRKHYVPKRVLRTFKADSLHHLKK